MEDSLPVPPFPENEELDSVLWVPKNCHDPQQIRSKSGLPEDTVHLPGHPLCSGKDSKLVRRLLAQQLLTPRLDDMSPILWMVSTRKSNRIHPLHRQIVQGREIILAEDPGLHLVWYYDKIYVKPIPRYLFNYAFWNTHLYSNDKETIGLRKAALGFMRTYFWLVQSEHDFEIAHERRLIPREIVFSSFLHFIDNFRSVRDTDVSMRYCEYGELRLSRLNLWSKLYKGEMFYYRLDAQYGAYFARFMPPFLFIFGSVSVALSGMSVALAVNAGQDIKPNEIFAGVSYWFSVVCLAGFALVICFFSFFQVGLLLRELLYVIRTSKKGRK